MNTYVLNVEDFGEVTLMPNECETYDVYDERANFLGEVNPEDYENWTDDEIILASIIEAELDEGNLGNFGDTIEYDDI